MRARAPNRHQALGQLRAALVALLGGEPFAGAGVPRRPRPLIDPESARAELDAAVPGVAGVDPTSVIFDDMRQ